MVEISGICDLPLTSSGQTAHLVVRWVGGQGGVGGVRRVRGVGWVGGMPRRPRPVAILQRNTKCHQSHNTSMHACTHERMPT